MKSVTRMSIESIVYDSRHVVVDNESGFLQWRHMMKSARSITILLLLLLLRRPRRRSLIFVIIITDEYEKKRGEEERRSRQMHVCNRVKEKRNTYYKWLVEIRINDDYLTLRTRLINER